MYKIANHAGNLANQQIFLSFVPPYTKSLVAGDNHSYALSQDKSVKCWELGSTAQLGIPDAVGWAPLTMPIPAISPSIGISPWLE
jgi:alpha-tubulin suppressor-like RCC1 family protein